MPPGQGRDMEGKGRGAGVSTIQAEVDKHGESIHGNFGFFFYVRCLPITTILLAS